MWLRSERREDPDRAYQEWLKTVRAAAEVTDVGPRVLHGEADAPEDPLFDSERDSLENVVRVDAHQDGEK